MSANALFGAWAQGSDEIRVGLIGCGSRGTGAARNVVDAAPGVRIVAMADAFKDRLDESRTLLAGRLGDKFAVFEPTHGSAPKYAGQYKVNPHAMLLTAKLMFDWLGESQRAAQLESAVARVIKEGKVKTYDMGGKNTTLEVAKEVAKYAVG